MGLTPYGTETMHVLRAEKGYIIVGQDTDGTVTPYDAGLGWAVCKAKKDFVGIRRPEAARPRRRGPRQLVGLKTKEPKIVLEEGAQIVADPQPADPDEDARLRHLVATGRQNLGRSIALALLEDGRNRMGETLHVPMPNGNIAVEVTGTVFFDEKGERANG